MRFDRSNQPAPGFSLDKRDIASRRGMKRREWRLILTLPLAVVFLGLAIQYLLAYAAMIPTGPAEPVIEERVLDPTPPARLADAAPLPDAAAVAALIPTVREVIADRATVRHEDIIGAETVAWAQELIAADTAAPPIPQRALARDLILGMADGAAVTIHGRLVDSVAAPVAGGAGFQRLAVQLDEQQTVQVLAPPEAATLVIGRPVQVIGRLLGKAPLPTGEQGETLVPLIAARVARPDEEGSPESEPDLAEMRTGVPPGLSDDLWSNVGDERSVLETRPYYLLLGQAKVDRATEGQFADAPSGNANADDIHQDPARFRGKPYTVIGSVYKSWEDPNVARDQPFGVAKVRRILLWNRDFGKVTEQVDGKTVIKSQILRLYEVCVSGDQPAPERGARIAVDGRFFKFRAIPVKSDTLRDARNSVTRQSDNVYTFVFVGAGYRIIPPPPAYELGSFDVIAVAVALAFIVLFVMLRRRDSRLESQISGQVRNLRSTRRTLEAARHTPATQAPTGQPPTAPSP